MKYAFLLYKDEARWENTPEAERMELTNKHMAYAQALAQAGKMVAGEPLEMTRTARTLSANGVVDGPYADTKEQLGGFYIVEAADEAEALELARQCPFTDGGLLEMRPVPDYGG
jgi:hypothetical protein